MSVLFLKIFAAFLGCCFMFAVCLGIFLSVVWTKRFLAKSAIDDRLKTIDARSIENNFAAIRQEQVNLRAEVSRLNLIISMKRKQSDVLNELMNRK